MAKSYNSNYNKNHRTSYSTRYNTNYNYNYNGHPSNSVGMLIVCLVAFVFFGVYFQWQQGMFDLLYFILFILIILVLITTVIALFFHHNSQTKRYGRLIGSIRKNNTEEYVINFLKTIGLQKRTGKNLSSNKFWNKSDFHLTWDEISTLRNNLQEKGINVTNKNYKEMNAILSYYAQEIKRKEINDRMSSQ